MINTILGHGPCQRRKQTTSARNHGSGKEFAKNNRYISPNRNDNLPGPGKIFARNHRYISPYRIDVLPGPGDIFPK